MVMFSDPDEGSVAETSDIYHFSVNLKFIYLFIYLFTIRRWAGNPCHYL